LALPPFQVGAGDVWFITRPDLGSVVGFGWFSAGRNAVLLPVYGAAVVFGLGMVLAALVRRRWRSVETWCWAMPLAWFGVPPVLLMVASLVVDPIWVARYATWSVPAASILVGGALVRLVRAPRMAGVLAVALVLVSVRGTLKWFDEPMREDYRSAAEALAAQAEPGDAVLFTPDETRIPAEYYLRRAGVVPDGGLEPGWPSASWGSWGTGDHRTVDIEAAQVDALAARAQRLWVMEYGDDGINDPRLARLDDRFRVVSLRVYRGPIILIGYERR
jgi:mannosyltransferase